MQNKPNVIFVIMDDLCWGDLACHDNPYTRTPNLDKMHNESARLTRYCTGPLCSPARASVMTGRYHMRTRVIDTYIGRSMIDPEETTLAQIMKNAGYKTGAFGKWHLGDCYPMRAMDLGFDETYMHNGGGIGQPGDHIDNCRRPLDCYFDPVLYRNGVPEKSKGYCTDVFADAAIDFIDRNQESPFFVYLATNAPHTPLIISNEWADTYRKMGINDTHARLYGMVENIDWNMGKIFRKLEDLKIADDTIVVYTSDHGPCGGAKNRFAPPEKQDRFNSGLRGIKGTLYNGGVQVPCFWHWPGKFQLNDISRTASPIDVMPTLTGLCGIDMPAEAKIDGLDLSPLLTGEMDQSAWRDRTVFMQWHRGDAPVRYRNYSVITDKYKIHRPDTETADDELYDMQGDLCEKNDLAHDSKGIAEEMRAMYDQWFDDVSSTRPDNYAPPRIFAGTDFETPTVLTRQDWRVDGEDGWENHNFGHWETFIAETGEYDVVARFNNDCGYINFSSGIVKLRLNDKLLEEKLYPYNDNCIFKNIMIPKGACRFEATLENDKDKISVFQLEISRSSQA